MSDSINCVLSFGQRGREGQRARPPKAPIMCSLQARNQDFMWGDANEANVDQTTEMYFLLSDPFIQESSDT